MPPRSPPPPRLPAAGWIVYLLRCRDGSLYAGITNDLPRRLAAHNSGKGAAYTRSRRPVAVVYREGGLDRSAALRREAALKRLTRAQKLELAGLAQRPVRRAARTPRSRRSRPGSTAGSDRPGR